MALLAITGHVRANMLSTIPTFEEPQVVETPSITMEQDFADGSFLRPQELKALFEIQMMDKVIDNPNEDMNWDIIEISKHRISRTTRRLPLSWEEKDVTKTKHVRLRVHFRNGEVNWMQMEAVKLQDIFPILAYVHRNHLHKHPSFQWTKEIMEDPDRVKSMV